MARVTVESELTENELLVELMNEVLPEIGPDEVCVSMMKEQGMTRDVADHLLKKKERAGELVSRDAIYKGSKVKAYRKVEVVVGA